MLIKIRWVLIALLVFAAMAVVGAIVAALLSPASHADAATRPASVQIFSADAHKACVSSSRFAGGSVRRRPCSALNGDQLWRPFGPGPIRNAAGLCLTAARYHAKTERCNGSVRQEWSVVPYQVNGFLLASLASDKCLALPKHGRLAMRLCNNTEPESWRFRQR